MIRELDTVVLSRDLTEHGLKQGDIGAVVHCYKGGESFEVVSLWRRQPMKIEHKHPMHPMSAPLGID